ncbi:unnamed protein product [Rhizoctonia solani]|uniref:Transcription factor domain-containing protein n=1 Tax=Rhizoctonia solani TaxID=456999 RepID=A0A8H3ANE2_9AGAM|nr:unnamed protein product [Rhizoctonia solani]
MGSGLYVGAANAESGPASATLTRPRDACLLSRKEFACLKSRLRQSSPSQGGPVVRLQIPPAIHLKLVYEPSHPGPFRQGRSSDWLFNTPLGSLVGPVETDPLSAFALLARMPVATSFEPATVSLLSSPMHDFLIASFMARRREYGLNIDEENFLTSFALPPDHPSAVHPALRNAVYLLACRALNTQTPALAQYEPSFVEKVRQGIADALEAAHQDKGSLFTGVILASTLLARYLLIMGRIREAYHQTASVARFGQFSFSLATFNLRVLTATHTYS